MLMAVLLSFSSQGFECNVKNRCTNNGNGMCTWGEQDTSGNCNVVTKTCDKFNGNNCMT